MGSIRNHCCNRYFCYENDHRAAGRVRAQDHDRVVTVGDLQHCTTTTTQTQTSYVVVGVLALQGAFEEHQRCLEAVGGCRTVQVRSPNDLQGLDGIILPGGESTAMGLIGTTATNKTMTSNVTTSTATINTHSDSSLSLWDCLRAFSQSHPTWGTCAGMILLADKCVGTSAVIEEGQALIGGVDITVCRNYFGSQGVSFEMDTTPPPLPPLPPPLPSLASSPQSTSKQEEEYMAEMLNHQKSYPGVFIRAPAILSAGPQVQVLGTVVATPCRQAAETLQALEQKQKQRNTGGNHLTLTPNADDHNHHIETEDTSSLQPLLCKAREVICAVRKGHILCTAFHPELTNDYRWHAYFIRMIQEAASQSTSTPMES